MAAVNVESRSGGVRGGERGVEEGGVGPTEGGVGRDCWEEVREVGAQGIGSREREAARMNSKRHSTPKEGVWML